MMAWVSGVVAVMWQGICGVVIRSVRYENGCGGVIAVLPLQAGIVDGAAVEPGRRTGLEASQGEPQTLQCLRE